MCKQIVVIFLCVFSFQTNAQSFDFLKSDTTDIQKNLPGYMVVETKFQHGHHKTTGVDELQKTIETNPFNTFEFRIGWRGYGRKKWQQLHNFTTYGVASTMWLFDLTIIFLVTLHQLVFIWTTLFSVHVIFGSE